jgi:hypothetical protein
MRDTAQLLKQALATVTANAPGTGLAEPVADSDLFSAMDSFAVVDLLLETEALLERAAGRYIALGDERVFDALQSPLRRWSDWVAHVEACRAR